MLDFWVLQIFHGRDGQFNILNSLFVFDGVLDWSLRRASKKNKNMINLRTRYLLFGRRLLVDSQLVEAHAKVGGELMVLG